MEGLAAGWAIGELAKELEAILFAPFTQRTFHGSLLVFMPSIELASTCKQ
jgi:hypothetical protein